MTTPSDLHGAFADPAGSAVNDRENFLRAVDRLPGLVPVRVALRRSGVFPAGGTVLDAGCGLGLETARLAADHPATTVIGLDHDPAILAAAHRLAGDQSNLQWREGDVTGLDLPAGSVDTVRTERVLMYVADLPRAADAIAAVLRPGGKFTGFELDYGATLLPFAGRSPAAVRLLSDRLADALPQPWAGRLVPEALAARGLRVTAVEPFTFAVDRSVWERIVADTLRVAVTAGRLVDAGLEGWLAEVGAGVTAPFRAMFTGTVTVAHRTG